MQCSHKAEQQKWDASTHEALEQTGMLYVSSHRTVIVFKRFKQLEWEKKCIISHRKIPIRRWYRVKSLSIVSSGTWAPPSLLCYCSISVILTKGLALCGYNLPCLSKALHYLRSGNTTWVDYMIVSKSFLPYLHLFAESLHIFFSHKNLQFFNLGWTCSLLWTIECRQTGGAKRSQDNMCVSTS